MAKEMKKRMLAESLKNAARPGRTNFDIKDFLKGL